MSRTKKPNKYANKRSAGQVNLDRKLISQWLNEQFSERAIVKKLNSLSRTYQLSRTQVRLDIAAIRAGEQRKE